MEEQNIPIDINNNKLLDWLISRRHVGKEWQSSVLDVREKINNAIQDMPAHDGIIKLLSGQHINYFHCLKLIEILKETEVDTKNVFGWYGSQRMKDWQNIISLYQNGNIYMAEAAQILIRNVSYEIPSLKKQVTKLEQSITESEKKIKECVKNESSVMKEFKLSCEQLGIAGVNIRFELLNLLNGLAEIYESAAEKLKLVKPTIELYSEFNKFLSGTNSNNLLPMLSFIIDHGNVTTYEYTYGEIPLHIQFDNFYEIQAEENQLKKDIDNQIDFGYNEIDFGEIPIEIDDFQIESQDKVDLGSTPSTDEEFEIVSRADLGTSLEESGIIVEKSGSDSGVAQGADALTLLDNPVTRDQLINELMEIHAFLKMRLFELSTDSDILAMSQMQNAPAILQMQTVESITLMSDSVNVALSELMNKRVLHLHNMKHSMKYVDFLTSNLNQKLLVSKRLKSTIAGLEDQITKYTSEISQIEPAIKILIEKTKQLQRDLQEDISKKYKGRIVNIVGGVNML